MLHTKYGTALKIYYYCIKEYIGLLNEQKYGGADKRAGDDEIRNLLKRGIR